MIVDIHTHTFPDKIAPSTIQKLSQLSHTVPFSDGTTAGLAASMKQAKVDWSVILPVATSPKQVVKINDSSAAINEAFRADGIHSIGCIHPDFPDWKQELARVADLGLKGIKIHSIYHETNADDPRYLRIYDRCGELGLVVIAHAGMDIGFPGQNYCTPAMFLNAVRQVGPVEMVLAHMGGWHNWDEVEELLVDTNLYLDTSYTLGLVHPCDDHFQGDELRMISDEQFLRIVRTFGSNRICFGTDSPWRSQEESLDLQTDLFVWHLIVCIFKSHLPHPLL